MAPIPILRCVVTSFKDSGAPTRAALIGSSFDIADHLRYLLNTGHHFFIEQVAAVPAEFNEELPPFSNKAK